MKRGRRAFLGFGLLIIVGTGLGAGNVLIRGQAQFVASLLRKRLVGLRIEDAELTLFCKAFLTYYTRKTARTGTSFVVGMRMLQPWRSWIDTGNLPGRIRIPLEDFETELFRSFLLGTDFMDVYSDPRKQVSFRYIPDPYQVGCSNQLAKFV